jgi:hypothetical protein
MAKSFDSIMAELKKIKEEQDFQESVKKVYSRPKNKLTRTVKKAAHQSPSSLECFKEENMYYTEKETRNYLEGTSYYETYQSMKDEWN